MTENDVQRRLEAVTQILQRLAEIPQASFEDFMGEYRRVDRALYCLQATIQALLDLRSLLVSKLSLSAPRTSAEILPVLEQECHFTEGSENRFRQIVGIWHRIVLLCGRVDEEIIYRILTEERGDLAGLRQLLLDCFDRRPENQ